MPGVIKLGNTVYDLSENDKFDLIICNHVIEHIDEFIVALANMKNMLAKGGILILGVPNEGAKWWQLAYDLEPNIRKITDHKHFFTMSYLINVLEHMGFEIAETKYIGYGLPHFTADSAFRAVPGVDDLMEQIGQKFFHDQASSMYIVCEK